MEKLVSGGSKVLCCNVKWNMWIENGSIQWQLEVIGHENVCMKKNFEMFGS